MLDEFELKLKEEFDKLDRDYDGVGKTLEEFEKRVSANADALISVGLKEWYRTRRKGKPPKKKKGQEDQLREIEDKLVEDRVEGT